MELASFLQELESRPYDRRAARLVDLGRQSRTDSESAALIRTLEAGGVYERRLALMTCPGSQDTDHLSRALSDPSQVIRRMATSMVSVLFNDQQAQSAIRTLSLADRVVLIHHLIHPKRKRYAPVDAYLTELAAAHDDTLSELLAFGSAPLVEKLFPQIADKAALEDLRRLARRHPLLMLTVFQQQAEALTAADRRLTLNARSVLPLTVDVQPEKTLDLIQSLTRYVPLAEFASILQALLDHLPKEIADLVISSADPPRLTFDVVADRLPDAQLLELVQRKLLALSAHRLRRIAPTLRVAIYAIAGLGWRDKDGKVSPDLIRVLPRDLREAEARRHLKLPILATRPLEWLPYLSFLPWAEALAAIEPYLRDPDADLRAAALSALIGNVRFERQALPDLITVLLNRRFEQDPVRQKIFQALQALPPILWRAEYLDSLDQIIRDALDAGDLSLPTMLAISRLIVRIFPKQPAWGSAALVRLIDERSTGVIGNLEQALSHRETEVLIAALLPVLERWKTIERAGWLLGVARMLGQRLRYDRDLSALLTRVIPDIAETGIALQMLALLVKYEKSSADSLIIDLLKRDPGWGTQAVVYNFLSRYRQDLLTPYLGQHAYKGKFTTGEVRVVPFFSRETLYRWSATQQRIYAESLVSLIDATEKNSGLAIRTIHMLTDLIYIPPDHLITLSSDQRMSVRETAIRALGRLQAGLGVPSLIAALDDDRARFAIYALRGALIEMSPADALDILRRVPLDRLTVAKEVVRLIGDLRTEDAYRELLTINERDLQRDVRIALLRALWNYLERPETWLILNQAAQGSDRALAKATAQIPDNGLSGAARQRLLTLIVALIDHPDVMVQFAALQRCGSLPVNDPDQLLLDPLIRAIESPAPDIVKAAASALFQVYRSLETAAISALILRIRSDRERLAAVLVIAMNWLRYSGTARDERTHAILSALASDSATSALRADLIVSQMSVTEVVNFMQQMAESRELHADALHAAQQALYAERWLSHWNDATLTQLEAQLMNSPDRYLRRLALTALLAAARLPSGWTAERRGRLELYRADSAPLVAEAAQFTFLPPV